MRKTDIWKQRLFIVDGKKNVSDMAIKNINSSPFFVLTLYYLGLPHLCLIGVVHTLSMKPEMYILNTGVFDSFLFPRARLLD